MGDVLSAIKSLQSVDGGAMSHVSFLFPPPHSSPIFLEVCFNLKVPYSHCSFTARGICYPMVLKRVYKIKRNLYLYNFHNFPPYL